jgi:SAM-dependent methyltransferase
MADESMVRNLAAQIEAIWPQERALFERHAAALGPAPRVLDVGCGTGELAVRLLELLPEAQVTGVDLDEAHLARARARCERFGARARFERGDAFALAAATGSHDLVVCRHVVQAVPEPERIVAELARVARPGGVVHVIAEDYGMMHFGGAARRDADLFWRHGALAYGRAIGCDLHVGRRAPALLAAAGLDGVRCDYVVVDTLRVPRRVFADIWRAWRDGYTDVLAETTSLRADEVRAYFEDMIACIESPRGYAVWQVPVVSGRKP